MTFLLTILGGYCLILGAIYAFQDRLLFLPSSQMVQHPEDFGLDYTDTWMETEDGVRLHGWFFPNSRADFLVILSHGNAGNISHRLDLVQTLLAADAAVLLYDYRGYGKSGGRPDEKGMYKDITAVINYLEMQGGYRQDQMIMYGRSLGGPVAAYAAATFKPAGLVLDSTFKNLRVMIRDVYPFVPAVLARHEFPTEKFVGEIGEIPVMVMHSPYDELVKFHNAEYLFDLAENPEIFVELKGGHNTNFAESRDLYDSAWKTYMQRLMEGRNAGKNGQGQ